ncbi:ion channel inhibitory toxin protein (macronuclear) [Tetrahymena thermophila SB210]|uniref:Ion channel inhibitory toxin protein n=1 Tax=Tetrahymena thermophila (strain SB210) TaxID=312017 RepID=W7XJS5_TETTS|nr:ion channel inhibitory toxin protein [Tetrahymena thermophila SB210]EWS74289.1 ion channel inhibitory toxin protein [Tetrahymena thermophila SB210]|eukprot:XP_012653177.1 ion channel inhibitory toxin protein [Tetrahymena thermophila SB210]
MRINNILIFLALALTLLLGTIVTINSSSVNEKIGDGACSGVNQGCSDDTDCCSGLRCQMVPQKFFGKCV